jgi:aldehyde dehydrogenase
VVGQIIPWNFPILMAVWKLAPALAAGNCIVLKPAEQTPMSIMVLVEMIGDLLPPGVLNVVNGFGVEAGKPLASNKRIAKIAFTGETTTGRLIMQYASENLIPVTLELGGKSPNIFFADIMDADDDYFDKASKASPCSRSIRARSAPAPAARWSRKDLRKVHRARAGPREGDQAGQPARPGP